MHFFYLKSVLCLLVSAHGLLLNGRSSNTSCYLFFATQSNDLKYNNGPSAILLEVQSVSLIRPTVLPSMFNF